MEQEQQDRDLRPELIGRLARAEMRAKEYYQKAQLAENEMDAIKSMIEVEDARFGRPTARVVSRENMDIDVLAAIMVEAPGAIIEKALTTGPKSKDEIRAFMESYGYRAEDGKSLGRIVHAALVAMKSGDAVRELPDQRWMLTK